MYFTNSSSSGSINRADMDGYDPRELVSGPNVPVGITIDFQNSRLYWTCTGDASIHAIKWYARTGYSDNPSILKFMELGLGNQFKQWPDLFHGFYHKQNGEQLDDRTRCASVTYRNRPFSSCFRCAADQSSTQSDRSLQKSHLLRCVRADPNFVQLLVLTATAYIWRITVGFNICPLFSLIILSSAVVIAFGKYETLWVGKTNECCH